MTTGAAEEEHQPLVTEAEGYPLELSSTERHGRGVNHQSKRTEHPLSARTRLFRLGSFETPD